MEWRTFLAVLSGLGLVVGTVASIALVPWMRLFFGTLAVSMSGVAAVGSLVVWQRPESLWFLGATIGFAGVGGLLLRWAGPPTADRGPR